MSPTSLVCFIHIWILYGFVSGQSLYPPLLDTCSDKSSDTLASIQDLQDRVRDLEIGIQQLKEEHKQVVEYKQKYQKVKETNFTTVEPRVQNGSLDTKAKNITKPRDCLDIQQSLKPKSNGAFTIYPDSTNPVKVLCDFDTDDGGWTIFHKRKDGTVSFYRDWATYKKGFGNVSTEYWLGNDNIHKLSRITGNNELYVTLENWTEIMKYAKYYTFSVNNEADDYRARVSNYTGTAGNGMKVNDNMRFSTKDRDNDEYSYTNCARPYTGAWWYQACSPANLNGAYYTTKLSEYKGDCNFWYYFSGRREPLKETVMMMRRK